MPESKLDRKWQFCVQYNFQGEIMPDRFDLEQQILDCWRITDEIPMMESLGANPADMTSLAGVYEFKFRKLWETFELMVAQRQFLWAVS
jgi:hypothetical protein